MATSSCRHCGYQPIAGNAVVCPKCGGTKPASRWWHGPLGLLAVVVVLVIGVALFT